MRRSDPSSGHGDGSDGAYRVESQQYVLKTEPPDAAPAFNRTTQRFLLAPLRVPPPDDLEPALRPLARDLPPDDFREPPAFRAPPAADLRDPPPAAFREPPARDALADFRAPAPELLRAPLLFRDELLLFRDEPLRPRLDADRPPRDDPPPPGRPGAEPAPPAVASPPALSSMAPPASTSSSMRSSVSLSPRAMLWCLLLRSFVATFMPRLDRPAIRIVPLLIAAALTACTRQPAPAPPPVPNVLLITVDTLRADRVGAYGHARAHTPVFDALARRGVRFERAYAAAPITLTSHASLLTGRYPRGHGARHNGLRVNDTVPLVTEAFARAGFATGAFVAAFPLDRRFGLARGFQAYGDRMPRSAGAAANERPGRAVADEAIDWLRKAGGAPFFLWVHLFEPHAPYGAPGDARPVAERYDDEVAETDRQAGRLIEALGGAANRTIVVMAADHGEAFGEHGEIAHSIFVYDTTLRVPLIIAGPGIEARVVETPVSLIDVAPTVARLAALGPFDADGVDLSPALHGGPVSERLLYAESFAPLLDFGWSPLRTVRKDGWKAIDAPRPELYHVAVDPDEQRDAAAAEPARLAALRESAARYSPADLQDKPVADRESASRLQALGYVGSGRSPSSIRADPKDRRQLAADLARVTSGELRGTDLEHALRSILAADPGNPQASMRLGFVLSESGRCAEAAGHFRIAIAKGLPGADPHLGLARCLVLTRRFGEAAAELRAADRAEPENPVVLANLGIVLSDGGRPGDAIAPLTRAVSIDPDFHEARFNLAIAYARSGHRVEAAREADALLGRLPPDAPQRAEVERLLGAVR